MQSEMTQQMGNPVPRLGFKAGVVVGVGRLSAIPRDLGQPADFVNNPFPEANRG